MSLREVVAPLLGRTVSLTVARVGPYAASLALEGSTDELLLPRVEVPEAAAAGDAVEVFVYLDSEDAPVATTRTPKLQLGEVAFLDVVDVTPIGAFVDWGLPKHLLIPFKEQTSDLQRGDRHPFGLLLDRSDRLSGTMKIRELLTSVGDFQLGEWVQAEAWRQEPGVGLFVIVERGFVGLVPAYEPHRLRRGEAVELRVAQVMDDGKIELSLRGLAHEELEDDAAAILAKLADPQAPKISEQLSPDQIRALFGLSKKAFKRAVGRLLKEGQVTRDESGQLHPRRG